MGREAKDTFIYIYSCMCSLNALIIFRYIFVGQWHYLRVDIKTHFHFSLFWVPFAILINTTLNCLSFKNLIKAVRLRL